MPNELGKNQWGEKNYPPKETLKTFLTMYAQRGLSIKEKLVRLERDLGLVIKKSKLNELERDLRIPSVRRPFRTEEELDREVLKAVEADVAQGNGPSTIKSMLKDDLIMVSRRKVREIMHRVAPEGFDKRFPGKRKGLIPRTALLSIGPFREVSGDGHEKLNAQALQMGSIGLSIYAYRDKFSGFLLKIDVLPNIRKSAAMGYVYLDLIYEYKGIPVQLTTDKGSEIGYQQVIQDALRAILAPDIDPEVDPSAVAIKSVHNTIIESLWRWLQKTTGWNLKDLILQGKVRGIFNPNIPSHIPLFYWIFVPLVQEHLDRFRTYFNNRRVRPQDDKILPSKHIPADALEHPDLYIPGTKSCLIDVPSELVDDCRRYLEEDVGPRENYLSWFSEDFDVIAGLVYDDIGSPKVTTQTAWDVFARMAGPVSDLYHDEF
ncbi:hypothetical protein CC1G_00656 [Coprinopsis cinerea okayama7|uniref:Integrase core domain-containing protein n=1 Tax=Coprinopsis cinerea (strain Okayama-7 / 130 / ATCC MYA-4618 / FGSC 9003) TaxID=240176 RepID=A8N3F2_COPC7|nr:hypothetical protein CC1G_00656 [Coprinopsis cinerea okayama7\|eukprot:XP_001829477.1 hypothetical protein CC1G_00656 [Coprinopsis cinerea okayama7\